MIQSKISLHVSIVIPVYNEAAHLTACLQSIADQTVAPYEVIVIDNNSTDASAEIAKSFDFVRVVRETRQGVVFARNKGFNTVRGDIIGRIDADTILTATWVATVQTIFSDRSIDAVSGSVYYYDISRPKLSGRLDLFFRQRLAEQLGNEVFLFGANMAIRRDSWRNVRRQVCMCGGIHEDFDLAIHAEQLGAHIVFDAQMQAGVSLRRFESGILEYWRYVRLSPSTYARHGRTSQRSMYPIILVVMAFYWFIWLSHQAYNPEKERISLRRIFMPAITRVNPATFVD